MRKFLYIIIAAIIVVMTPAIALAQGDDAPTCLAAVAGTDTGGFAATTVSGESAGSAVSVTNHVDIVAVSAARTITEDAVRYVNNCGTDIELALVAQAPLGDWNAVQAELFLSTIDAPTSLPTADVDGSWADQPLTVTATTTVGAAGDSVVVPAGSSAQVAFVVTAGADFEAASLRWSAEARTIAG